MKRPFVFLALLILAATPAARATFVYSGTQNIPIPLTFAGVYLRIDTGSTSAVRPANWNTAPWMNPFFGGVDIGTSALFRPVVAGLDQIRNLAYGTAIDGGSNYPVGESGSTTHVGPGAGQFLVGVPGTMGFTFKEMAGGPDYYGWLNLVINNAGTGRITDFAFDNTPGTAMEAGVLPEPGTAFFGLAVAGAVACRRKRGRESRMPM